jgi:hypothetical protein
VRLLRTITGKKRMYRPGNRVDLAAFKRDFGDDKENLKRLADAGAIQLTTPSKVQAETSVKPVAKAAPRRTRSKRKTA